MAKHKSIGQRLKTDKPIEHKLMVAQSWVTEWEAQHSKLIAQLERSIQNDDYDQLCIATGQLKVEAKKRFTALPNVLNVISQIDKNE